jgi:hypothetical protein
MTGGGEISGNEASAGGGVYVTNSGTFTMEGGIIYGTDADASLQNTATDGAAFCKGSNTATATKNEETLDTTSDDTIDAR